MLMDKDNKVTHYARFSKDKKLIDRVNSYDYGSKSKFGLYLTIGISLVVIMLLITM